VDVHLVVSHFDEHPVAEKEGHVPAQVGIREIEAGGNFGCQRRRQARRPERVRDGRESCGLSGWRGRIRSHAVKAVAGDGKLAIRCKPSKYEVEYLRSQAQLAPHLGTLEPGMERISLHTSDDALGDGLNMFRSHKEFAGNLNERSALDHRFCDAVQGFALEPHFKAEVAVINASIAPAINAQQKLSLHGGVLQLLKPGETPGFAQVLERMHVQHTSATDCYRRRGLPQDEAVAGNEHNRLGEFEPE